MSENFRAPSMKPLSPAGQTQAVRELGPFAQPQATVITPDLKTDLSKLNPEIASKVRAVVNRKSAARRSRPMCSKQPPWSTAGCASKRTGR